MANSGRLRCAISARCSHPMTEKYIGEPAVTRIPERHRDRQHHQRLEIDHHRRMEIHRLEFGDVLQLIGVGDVLEHVPVQLPAIGIDEGDREAGERKASSQGCSPPQEARRAPGRRSIIAFSRPAPM